MTVGENVNKLIYLPSITLRSEIIWTHKRAMYDRYFYTLMSAVSWQHFDLNGLEQTWSKYSVCLSVCLSVSVSLSLSLSRWSQKIASLSFLGGGGVSILKYSFTFQAYLHELCISCLYNFLISPINLVHRLKEETQISQLTHDGWWRRLGWASEISAGTRRRRLWFSHCIYIWTTGVEIFNNNNKPIKQSHSFQSHSGFWRSRAHAHTHWHINTRTR